ncbi:hypothetical protein [Kibdelosporangium phytohabitans]|uniref:Chorismate synthase n=1 Tax=Kibdelosporangium phytohabitans TaxID=860235 RepID=A0A0N9I793_9PSEU|nr:hypothetical protein [Kibdelosporangium phytohabitans]ALG11992.1 hypothetical protein AOZ06_38565 [Kibdelosporangium phytohabitans]MBE1463459.1 putative GNAT superfamily acetyltransferase [Kibdelosporangium phytohabitans]
MGIPTPVPHVSPAQANATGAGIRIHLADDYRTLDQVSRFLAGVWQTPASQPPFTSDALRAIEHSGGAVHYASGDGIVAASVLVFGPPDSRAAYSMIAAARTSDRGTGHVLKQAQREWALERGATTMIWTFDPLVSRNAHFNIAKLGATATEYTVDFFGPVNDGVNGHDDTDRLTAVWPLTEPRPSLVAGPDLHETDIDPRPAPDGKPVIARDDGGYWCRVPRDIVAMRRADQQLAARWRVAVRDVLLPIFDAGFTATGFSRSGWYRLTRQAGRP